MHTSLLDRDLVAYVGGGAFGFGLGAYEIAEIAEWWFHVDAWAFRNPVVGGAVVFGALLGWAMWRRRRAHVPTWNMAEAPAGSHRIGGVDYLNTEILEPEVMALTPTDANTITVHSSAEVDIEFRIKVIPQKPRP